MSMGHSVIVFRVLSPKISTSQEKLAPTGLHGLHVFATLPLYCFNPSQPGTSRRGGGAGRKNGAKTNPINLSKIQRGI